MRDYTLSPISVKSAIAWVKMTHRHLPRIQGGLFAVAVEYRGLTVGVALAGKPAPAWDGKPVICITRCAVLDGLPKVGDHAAPACSMLYGALVRASVALGYKEIWTYTLPHESGASLRACGFEYMGETRGGELTRPKRPRSPVVNPSPKGRWRKVLG